MKIPVNLFVCLLLITNPVYSQVAVDNTDPHPSSVLDLGSTDKGLLIPRMTSAQRQAIVAPANSLLVYDITVNGYFYYNSGQWLTLSSPWSPAPVSSDIYYNSGNVGIGTTTPNVPLQFANTIANRKVVLYEEQNNDHKVYGFGVPTGGGLRYQVAAASTDHTFYAGTSTTTSNELFKIKGTGDIEWAEGANGASNSINIGNPRSIKLGYSGGNYGCIGYNTEFTTTSDTWNYEIGDLASMIMFRSGGMRVLGTSTSGTAGEPIAFTTFFDINNSGQVKIGAPPYSNATLSVARGAGVDGALTVGGSVNTSHFNYSTTEDTYIRGGKATSHVIINDASSGTVRLAEGGGNVAIGASTASYKLDVVSTANSKIRAITNGVAEVSFILQRTVNTPSYWELYTPTGSTDFRFYMGTDRFIFTTAGVGTGTDWVATSDSRLKYNIVAVGRQLDRINSIAKLVREYDRTDTKKHETGFVAQELLEVAPEYVNVPDDSVEMMSVNYSKMVVPLYKAVSELNDEIEALKLEIAELKALLQK